MAITFCGHHGMGSRSSNCEICGANLSVIQLGPVVPLYNVIYPSLHFPDMWLEILGSFQRNAEEVLRWLRCPAVADMKLHDAQCEFLLVKATLASAVPRQLAVQQWRRLSWSDDGGWGLSLDRSSRPAVVSITGLE